MPSRPRRARASFRPIAFEPLESRSLCAVDLGDAPDQYWIIDGTAHLEYATQVKNDAPRHLIGGPRLGALVDGESDDVRNSIPTQEEGLANTPYGYGDNLVVGTSVADEDGVFFPQLLVASTTTDQEGQVKLDIQQATGVAYVDAWIDFNSDGDFTDPREQILTSLAVTNGLHDLSFTIPAGATFGKTYARFRLSSQGGLQSVGVLTNGSLPDGEVEDYAVLIGGGSPALEALTDQILKHRLPSGLLRSSIGPGLRDVDNNNKEWYPLDIYFSSFAQRAVLAAPSSPSLTDAFKLAFVEQQLDFWLQGPGLRSVPGVDPAYNAVISRLLLDINSNPLAHVVRVPQTNGEPDQYFNPETYGADADDSSLAVALTLAADFARAGGSTAVLDRHRAALEWIGRSLRHLIQANDLTVGFVDPAKTALYPFQQTMDNFEVLQGLRDFAWLQRNVYGNDLLADEYDADADRVARALDGLYDSNTGLYFQYALFGNVTSRPTPVLTDVLYPMTLLQAFPAVTGAIAADSPRAQALIQKVIDTRKGQPLDWVNQTLSGSLALAAVGAGKTTEAKNAVAHLLQWALQNAPPFPSLAETAARDAKGNPLPTVATIADFAFLLQALLPAANDEAVRTPLNTVANIDVRANDFSLLPEALTVQIVGGPTQGTASVVNGAIRYTPTTGFEGRDIVSYAVIAADGGRRIATAEILVGAPWHNREPGLRSDVNGDGTVDPQDILWVVYFYVSTEGAELPWPPPAGMLYQKVDVNGNNRVEPDDILYVLYDYELARRVGEGEISDPSAAEDRSVFEEPADVWALVGASLGKKRRPGA